jgi:diadenosine tetraphosphate (Ap4A) HIT family hydrolase
MKYIEALKTYWKDYSPFLHVKPEEIVDESENFIILGARAPYAENHLLIIPKRKVYLLKELNWTEKNEMWQLLGERTTKLRKKHKDINLLLRDWLVGWNTGKSINHLHFHLIPDCSIWLKGVEDPDNRKFFNDEEYIENVEKIRKDFL